MVGIELELVVLALFCLAGSWFDLSYRRLPNWLSLLASVTGLAFAFTTVGAEWSWWWFPAHGFLALLVGMGLFAIGWIGGGDAKFYAAIACWFPLQRGFFLLATVTLVGLLVLIVWFIARRLQGKKIRGTTGNDAAKLPYGIAIALGALVAFGA